MFIIHDGINKVTIRPQMGVIGYTNLHATMFVTLNVLSCFKLDSTSDGSKIHYMRFLFL